MTQMNLFSNPPVQRMEAGVLIDGDRYWDLAERSGSSLQEFYNTREHSAYTAFAQSCQQFADETGISFIHASNKIHIMFNVNVMGNR